MRLTRIITYIAAAFWLLGALTLGAAAAPAADPPELISPPDGAHTTGLTDPPLGVPSLRWLPVTGATRYHVQVSTSAGFATTVVDTDTYATTYTPTGSLPDGVYYWRVKAMVLNVWEAYSSAWSFQKDWTDGDALVPQLSAPSDGATRYAYQHPDFLWSPVAGAATYRFEISLDPAFTAPTYSAITVRARHTPTLRLASNLYYWRVIPVDVDGNAGAPSDVWTFTFAWDLAPELLNPAENVDLAFAPRFSWTAVEAAKQYRLEISTQPDFSSSLRAYVVDQTDYTPVNTLANDQDYYWRVRAIDARGVNGPWSAVRRFRMRWNFQAQLLTPLNNAIHTAFPYFSWAPIPGAERYQVQIDESTSFSSPIADVTLYNSTSYTQPSWANVLIGGDYFWRVRGIDTENNYTPWSALRSLRPSYQASPNPIYPPYSFSPAAETPVYTDHTIAWPVFVWNTAHIYDPATGRTTPPDYYQVTVDDDPGFGSPNFQTVTAGNAAAPTASAPFQGLVNGSTYYWRVRALRAGQPIGVDSTWVFHYDANFPQLEPSDQARPLFPRDLFEAVGAPPVLGWTPVTGATAYRVQVASDRDFTQILEDVATPFVHYAPWQGRTDAMPFGVYWWRVRADEPAGQWSYPRRFHVSLDAVTGNSYDLKPSAKPASILTGNAAYQPALSFIASSPVEAVGAYDLGALHAMLDRTLSVNLSWAIAFGTKAALADALHYVLYFDTDHVEGSGGATDPEGRPVTVSPLHLPEYVLYIQKSAGQAVNPNNTRFYRWLGSSWGVAQTLAATGGDVWLDAPAGAVQVLIPYTAIGSEDPGSAGSLGLTVFTTALAAGDGVRDAVPEQTAPLSRPALVSDMLQPLYPFDTPPSNPTVERDFPAVHWRMPYYDSVDGYQVQVARDAAFTQVIESWESFESNTWTYYALMPAAFASGTAKEDNESYYWRVRIRHERYTSNASFFDYGRWSPGSRFKLDSRRPGNPTLSTGPVATTPPTFQWDRVEGAAGYALQVDNDANFTSPLIDARPDDTTYTWDQALANGTYFWRVAIRRSDTVFGSWTAPISFVVSSVCPTLTEPAPGETVGEQPDFRWQALLAPADQPRLAASRYQLQVSADPNFSAPKKYDTDSTGYTLKKGESVQDGTYYWRVAMIDPRNRVGTFSASQAVYKEYPPPMLTEPVQGGVSVGIPSFAWEPVPGASSYRIQIANNELFNGATTATTENTHYTPVTNLARGNYYWRVQMIDIDGKVGPYEVGRVRVGATVWVPAVYK